jgi:hypothetical protein
MAVIASEINLVVTETGRAVPRQLDGTAGVAGFGPNTAEARTGGLWSRWPCAASTAGATGVIVSVAFRPVGWW